MPTLQKLLFLLRALGVLGGEPCFALRDEAIAVRWASPTFGSAALYSTLRGGPRDIKPSLALWASFLALIRCVIESRDESCPIEIHDESEAALVDSTLMPAMPEMIDLGEHDGVRGMLIRAARSCRVGIAHH